MVNTVSVISLIIAIVVLVVLAYAGVLRSTGLAGRTGAQREDDRNRATIANWLKYRGPES